MPGEDGITAPLCCKPPPSKTQLKSSGWWLHASAPVEMPSSFSVELPHCIVNTFPWVQVSKHVRQLIRAHEWGEQGKVLQLAPPGCSPFSTAAMRTGKSTTSSFEGTFLLPHALLSGIHFSHNIGVPSPVIRPDHPLVVNIIISKRASSPFRSLREGRVATLLSLSLSPQHKRRYHHTLFHTLCRRMFVFVHFLLVVS